MSNFVRFVKDWKNQKSYGAWLMQYAKPYLPKVSFIMFIDILNTFVSTWLAVLSKNIIDDATAGNGFVSVLIAYAVFTILMMVLGGVKDLMSITLDEKFSFGIRKQLYEKIINSYWMEIKKYHTGDLMTRLTSDATNISNGIIYTIPTIIELIVQFIVAFFTLFYYQHLLALFALTMGPIAAVISWLLGRRLKKLTAKVQETESAYRSFMQESLANLLVVKSFANEDYAINRLVELRDERFRWVYKKGKLGVISSNALGLTFNIGYIVAFSLGALMISTGDITYGTMSLFITLINRIQSPIIGLASQIPKVVSIFASAERVMTLQDMPREEKIANTLVPENIGVRLNDVTFGYVENEKVLNNLSMEIKPGEFAAIIGESGIGKTTLIRLMMSFMNKYSGYIEYYNEQGQSTQANVSTREWMSYVPQGNTLFSGSIRENIRMGKLDATEEEMIAALKRAAAYDFVKDLPNGLDTIIGERGHGISEGQAQRIAIARCLVRKAPFIILDEATSSLDPETELAVLEGIKRIEPRPTCIIITHRLSVLPYCDKQIKIENVGVI